MIKIHLWLPDFYQPERNGLYLGAYWFPVQWWKNYCGTWAKLPKGQALPLERWLPRRALDGLSLHCGLPGHLRIHCNALPL